MKLCKIIIVASLLAFSYGAQATCTSGTNVYLCETKEIRYTGDAADIKTRVDGMSALEIYHYVRNNAEFVPYSGIKSDIVHTANTMQGNNVDLSILLIAMLRSQGIEARFSMGSVQMENERFSNWLNIDDDASVAIRQRALQGHYLGGNNDLTWFHHVWVEALLPYNNYRGIGDAASQTCTDVDDDCRWVALDPSFKERHYPATDVSDIIASANAPFDYDLYHNVEAPSETPYEAGHVNKSVLDFYKEDVKEYLNQQTPPVALSEVIEPYVIKQDNLSVLPATFPYKLGSSGPYHRDSVEDYESNLPTVGSPATDYPKWKHELSIYAIANECGTDELERYGPVTVDIRELSIKPLSISWEDDTSPDNSGTNDKLNVRLGDTAIGTLLDDTTAKQKDGTNCTVSGNFALNSSINLIAEVEYKHNWAGSNSSTYENIAYARKIGQKIVIGVSTPVSHKVQVLQAKRDLLALYDTWPLVYDGSGDPFVDNPSAGTQGSYDVNDTALDQHEDAFRDYSNALLEVANRHYEAQRVQQINELGAIVNVSFDQVISIGFYHSEAQIEHFDDIPFGVTPMHKVIHHGNVLDPYESDADTISNNRTNDAWHIMGYIASSLEHEVWQDVNHIDAYSTIGTFQDAKGSSPVISLVDYTLVDGDNYQTVITDTNHRTWLNLPDALDPYDMSNTDNDNDYQIDIQIVDTKIPLTGGDDYYAYIVHAYYTKKDGSALTEKELIRSWYTISGQNNGGNESDDETGESPLDDNVTSEEQPAEADNGEETPSSNDPISTVTGNMYHDEVDLVIPGIGLNYQFTRTFNSKGSRVAEVGNSNNYPLSKGWTHSYNMKLVANDFGEFYGDGNALHTDGHVSSITYINARGTEFNYPIDVNGGATQPTEPVGVFNEMVLDDPDENVAGGYHSIKFRNGTKYVFEGVSGADMTDVDDVARLYKIKDAYGKELTFTYNGSGQLTDIDDNLGITGRTGLTLTYHTSGNGNGRLHKVTDWESREWVYAYDSESRLSTVTNPESETITYTYDGDSHRVEKVEWPQVRNSKKKSATFSYYENGKGFEYIDALGNRETLEYDKFRSRTTINLPNGEEITHYFDNRGDWKKYVDELGGFSEYKNNADDLMWEITDVYGDTTQYSYQKNNDLDADASDTGGNVTRIKNKKGDSAYFDYSYFDDVQLGLYDKLTKYTDWNGNEFEYEYYAATNAGTDAVKGKLKESRIKSLDSGGSTYTNVVTRSFTYYADSSTKHGQPKQMIEYITPISGPSVSSEQRKTDFTYDYSVIAPGVRVTRTITGVTENDTRVITDDYDDLWRLTSRTLQRQTSPTDSTLIDITTAFTYDDAGRLTEMVMPEGEKIEYTYDDNGKVTASTAYYPVSGTPATSLHSECTAVTGYHKCEIATYTYDLMDRLIETADIGDNTLTFERDVMGNIVKRTDALGNITEMEYDAKSRLTAVIDGNGNRTAYQFDALDRLIAVTDANGNTTTFEYDVLGRRTKVVTPGNRELTFDEYDANGNLLYATNANANKNATPVNTDGYSVTNEYDELNRLTSSLNAENGTTTIEYDLLGNVLSITDAENQETLYDYDDLGRLIEIEDPIKEAGTDKKVTFTYDEANNLLSATDRLGEVTRYTYDKNNRIEQINYVDDATQDTFTYDQYGDLISAQNSAVTYTYTYDAWHRLTSKTDSRNNLTLSYTYDAMGNLVTKTDYQGEVSSYRYDGINRLVGISNSAYQSVSYRYDAAGRLQSRILSSGAKTLYEYDTDSRVTKLTYVGVNGTELNSKIMEYDEVGNITKETIGVNTITYTYDALHRITGADYSAGWGYDDLTFTYDKVGNRKTAVVGATTFYYVYNNDGNRLDKVCTALNVAEDDCTAGNQVYRYSYNDNGSLTAEYNSSDTQTASYSWNQKGQLTEDTSNSKTTSYAYDIYGYRINQTYDDASEEQYLLEGPHLEAIYDENDNLEASYQRGLFIDEIVSANIKVNGRFVNHSFYQSLNNSVEYVEDHNGTVQQTTTFSPFGKLLAQTGASLNSSLYTGRSLDSDSGLNYYRARYYNSETGRFISEDPIGFAGGINFYAYVSNNPLGFIDPFGFEPKEPLTPVQPESVTSEPENSVRGITQDSTAEEVLTALTSMAEGESITGKELTELGGLYKNAKHIKEIVRTEDGVTVELSITARFALAVIPDTPSVENNSEISITPADVGGGEQGFHVSSETIKIHYSLRGEKDVLDIYVNNDGYKESIDDVIYYIIKEGGW